MSIQCKHKKNMAIEIVGLGLLLFFLGAGIAQDFGYAEGRYYREDWQLPGFYPTGFDGYGIIDRIDSDEVVISDTLYKLAPEVTYNTLKRNNTSDAAFGTGRQAAFLFNRDREITSLWLISPPR
jgi:hypothetical protein